MPPLLAVNAALVPPPAKVRMFQDETPAPSVVNAYPDVPAVAGNLKVQVPATSAVATVTTPEVSPDNRNVPAVVPATPSNGVAVMLGIPVAPVLSMPPFAVASADITFAEEAYSSVLTALVAGYVVVDHAGVVDAPDNKSWFAVAVPARIAPADAVE